jgi:tetratricopeptide (TPR) repeat protein
MSDGDGPLEMQSLVSRRRQLFAEGDAAGAEAAYAQMAERNAEEWDSLSYTLLGDMFEEAGDLAGAKAAYTRAVEDDTMFGRSSIYKLGQVLQQLGERDAAVETFIRGIETGDTNNRAMGVVGIRELIREAGPCEWSSAVYKRTVATGNEWVCETMAELNEELGGALG